MDTNQHNFDTNFALLWLLQSIDQLDFLTESGHSSGFYDFRIRQNRPVLQFAWIDPVSCLEIFSCKFTGNSIYYWNGTRI